MKPILRTFATLIFFALTLLPWHAYGQEATQSPLLSKEEIEQLVAPIALYPDPLIAQILMASTYPLEVVSAARWVETNPNLTGQALEDALQQQPWDASVKSLTAVPEVLDMLNTKLDMTQRLGDAFLAQQKDVLDAVQALRGRAQSAGNLNSSSEQVVTTTQEAGASIITIEPSDPEVIYVPTYDSSMIYGNPSDYIPGTALLSFGVGLAVGNAIWGHTDWSNGNVDINVERYNNFNRTDINNSNWTHNVDHRRGVPYRDGGAQQRYGRDQRQDVQSREAFRGRAEQGRQELARGGANLQQGLPRTSQGTTRKQEKPNLTNQQRKMTQPSRSTRDYSDNRRSQAFDGINRGTQTRNYSNRGGASRASAMSHGRGGFSGGGGSRGGRGGGGGRRR